MKNSLYSSRSSYGNKIAEDMHSRPTLFGALLRVGGEGDVFCFPWSAAKGTAAEEKLFTAMRIIS